jgi:hypothetical protein
MFVTVPGFSFPVPAPLKAHSEAQYWRAVSIDMFAAWYVATIVVGQGDEPATFVFTWDTDLAQTIENSAGVQVLSLLCMVFSRETGWTAIPVAEVWRALDPELDGQPCVLLLGCDGLPRAGYQGSHAPLLQRDRLIARVAVSS